MSGADQHTGLSATDESVIRVGDRVKLNANGLSALLGEIYVGRLSHGLKRRSCHNRKLTDMSLGVVISVRDLLATVKWDHLATEQTIAIGFLRRIVQLRVIEF